ncbi:LacI family DNA-binding transcriptional regulator [Granulicella cerasi]|uniref:LacI family DNA-binding transcriptional regulator n=1 Tax=Granulicella cerasi TaxID=741063 RepID=A0ABW1Z6H7_9BACT|nr:LacI family DNA-binding transcriptional regulator [Granulicella cerasi]
MSQDGTNSTGGRQKPASLATIAKHVGLSVAAISRVLNQAPAAKSIPKATQDRIFAAAAELNYRPNALARSLRHGRSHTVGVLVPEMSEGYTTLVLSGLEQGLLQSGYFYILVSHHHRPELIARSQALLIERSVDALVAIDTILESHLPVPTVTISCPDEQEGYTNIVLNHRRAAELAIGHLVGMGHRSIAVIKGQPFSSDTAPRWDSIAAVAEEHGIQIDERLVSELEGDGPSHEPGYFATQRLLAAGVPFTALFAFNDVSAIGAIRALREAGLRVPQDVSVVGFDDIQSAAFQNPGLTTVRQPLKTMGMLAAETVVRQIGTQTDYGHAKQLQVDPELVVRDSTCPPPRKN